MERGGVVDWLRGTYYFRHAQVVLSVACGRRAGTGACRWCREGAAFHTLTFTADHERGVKLLIDRQFRQSRWALWSLQCAVSEAAALQEWLLAQTSVPFAFRAECVNGTLAPWFCCVPPPLRGCIALGVRDGRYVDKKEEWFCVELCVAALHRIGYLLSENANATSPDRIASLLDACPTAHRCATQ